MTKSQIKSCPKCKCLTEHTYKGKVDDRTAYQKDLDRTGYIFSLGIFYLVDKVLDKPPKKYFECNRCKHISIK